MATGSAHRARRTVPRSAHARPILPSRDPVALLEEQARARIAELIPVRYARMLTSEFAFFRGAAAVQAYDVAADPRTGLNVQLCGDAHLSNFGLFATPERRLAFDLNDFDETVCGPFEWDVKRFAASVEIAARGSGYSSKKRQRVLRDALARYRQALHEFARMGALELWYTHLSADVLSAQTTPATTTLERTAQRIVAKARSRDHLQAFSKLVVEQGGALRFASDPPFLVRLSDMTVDVDHREIEGVLRDVYERYVESLAPDRRVLLQRYTPVDIAHKVVGVGSVGTRAWVVLFMGRDSHDPLLLQIKQALPSVLEQYLPTPQHPHPGERVVAGQRLIQAHSDIFLGWTAREQADGSRIEFQVRQLRDWKGSVDVDTMTFDAFHAYTLLCAWTLARAHARSGDVHELTDYVGRSDRFDRALAEYARLYADQNARDFEHLRAAAQTGRIAVAARAY